MHDPWRSWFTTGMAVRFGHSVRHYYAFIILSFSVVVFTRYPIVRLDQCDFHWHTSHTLFLLCICLHFDFDLIQYFDFN
jgi:hypothetical protein